MQPPNLKTGAQNVLESDSYCYLGITIHRNGTKDFARTELKGTVDNCLLYHLQHFSIV